jgi:hypothetical protein
MAMPLVRVPAAALGAGASAGAAAAVRGSPHLLQNLLPEGFFSPHLEQNMSVFYLLDY